MLLSIKRRVVPVTALSVVLHTTISSSIRGNFRHDLFPASFEPGGRRSSLKPVAFCTGDLSLPIAFSGLDHSEYHFQLFLPEYFQDLLIIWEHHIFNLVKKKVSTVQQISVFFR